MYSSFFQSAFHGGFPEGMCHAPLFALIFAKSEAAKLLIMDDECKFFG